MFTFDPKHLETFSVQTTNIIYDNPGLFWILKRVGTGEKEADWDSQQVNR